MSTNQQDNLTQQQVDDSVIDDNLSSCNAQNDGNTQACDNDGGDCCADCGNKADGCDNVAAKRRMSIDRIVNTVLIVAIAVLLVFNLVRIFVVSEVTVQQNSMQPTFDPNDVVVVNKLQSVSRGDVVVVYKNDVDKFAAYFGSASDKGANGKYELLIKRVAAVAGDSVWLTQVDDGSTVRYALNVQKNGTTYQEFYVWDTVPVGQNYQSCIDGVAGKYVLAQSLDEALTQGKYALQITMSASTVGMLADFTQAAPYTLADGQLLLLGDNRDHSNDSRQMGFSNVERVFGVVVKQTRDN